MSPFNLLWAQLILSSDILKIMDQTADPCEDFYQYACGNYSNRIQLPEDEPEMDNFVEVGKRIGKQLRELLEEPTKSTDPKSSILSKTFYKACFDVNTLEKLGLEPWKKVIDNAGGWPMVKGKDWKGDGRHWMQRFAYLAKEHGAQAILSIDISIDSKNSTRRILNIDQTGLSLGKREYYLEANHTHILEAFHQFLLGTALLLGADNKTVEEDVNDFIKFETQLANITVKDEDRKNFTELYDLITIGELKQRYPKIPLHIFFDEMIKSGWNLTDDVEINVVGGPYLNALPNVLLNVDNRTLANYQMWDIVKGYYFYIPPSQKDIFRKFREIVSGVKQDNERWEQCVDSTSGNFLLPVSSMYVKRHFRSTDKAEMDRMVSDIRKAMRDVLTNSAWMDETTKDFALKKLSALLERIGYPPYIYNETRLLRFKENITLSEDKFMENAVAISRMSLNATIRLHHMPVNRSDWDLSAAAVNAMYSLDHNTITFPAGILQYPFFASYAPISVNYGRIGSVIGHEITHGYDDMGRQFDANGNLESWWTDETLENFINKTKCFIEQYGTIYDKETGYKLNGDLELGENIADNGGLKLAYQAYRSRIAENKNLNISLPGLSKFTSDQLFFISFGQTWCEIIRVEALKDNIVSDSHSPHRYRVNVPLKNFPVFATTFHCPTGSHLNPEKRCSIW